MCKNDMLIQAVTALAIQESETKHLHFPFADDDAFFRACHAMLQAHPNENASKNEGNKKLCDTP